MFGTPLRRTILYYVCLLLVVGATLPNWFVPPNVRRENSAAGSLRKYAAAFENCVSTSKDAVYPPKISALAAVVEAGKIATSGVLDSELVCPQVSCVKACPLVTSISRTLRAESPTDLDPLRPSLGYWLAAHPTLLGPNRRE